MRLKPKQCELCGEKKPHLLKQADRYKGRTGHNYWLCKDPDRCLNRYKNKKHKEKDL